MATCKQSASELIQDVFSPCVAVLCSSDVEQICSKNNLTFVEMVQPFCRLNTEVTIRDPNNMSCAIKNFRVLMKDLHSQPPSLTIGKKMMHDAVASNSLNAPDGILMNNLNVNNYLLKYCSSTPWFEAYREVFFQVTLPMEHEFIHHYLSCIFVVSSSHQDPLSQIDELSQQLLQHQQNSSHNSKWFFSNVFKYYLLLHDVSSEDLAKAEAVYQSMKSSYDSTSCHLLQINSADQSKQVSSAEESSGNIMPDPWSQFLPKYCMAHDKDSIPNNTVDSNSYEAPLQITDSIEAASSNSSNITNSVHHPLLCNSEKENFIANSLLGGSTEELDVVAGFSSKLSSSSRPKRHGLCLTPSDMDRIKCFVQEFCIQGLIPHIEKQIRILSDQVANRKGIHRTFFGVTRKLFAGNKPGIQNPASSLNSVVYSQDAPELQVRKLGDLAFMFQLYEVAYQAYHNAKRDFNADQAWLHFAGASEMAALSAFMQNSNPEYPARYIESAITTYMYTCKLPELATRATFLSTECLKAKGLYRDAAAQFVRMPSEADLPSALCLEQAAYCYINCKPPKIRKYAFHTILAGHRFSKAGQKKHALRSYKQAEQVYRAVGWNFANNHINFTIGRLSVQLDQLECACLAFEPLLISKCLLPATEQAGYLKEYLFVLKRLISQKSENDNSSLPVLPVPIIEYAETKVLLADDSLIDENGSLLVRGRGFDRGDLNNDVWTRLEEMVVNHVQKMPLNFSQLQCFTSNTNNVSRPNAVIGETISVEVALLNPLSMPLIIEDVHLLWTFTSDPGASNVKEPVTATNELNFSKALLLNSIVQTQVLNTVTLGPLQKQKVHLKLVPQHTGQLSIKGVAYSLLASQLQQDEQDSPNQKSISLQGKQIISVKGPRLNRTTKERTAAVYAEDNRLNINVLSPMPKLEVTFLTFPSNLYCGEIQKITAEFCNVGQRKLQRIFITSPTPGIFAVGSLSESDGLETMFKEVSSKRWPSPVIAEWDSNDWIVELYMPDGGPCMLDPGQRVAIPMWFKGPDAPGVHDLDLLFYYESDNTEHKLRYRLLQLSTVLSTYPSVSVQSKAMLSFSSEEQFSNFHPAALPSTLVLTSEVENISQELSQVSLVQISCISKDWCFVPSEDNCRRGLSVIHPGESLLLILKAIGFDPKTTVSSQRVRVFSNIPMGRVEVDCSSTPCSDFSQKCGLDLKEVLSNSVPKNVISSTDADAKKETNVVLLLVVIWKAKLEKEGKECIITGQHHVSIDILCSSSQVISPEQTEEALVPMQDVEKDEYQTSVPFELPASCVVKCSLSYPFRIEHNFKLKRTVTVPVFFIAHSMSNTEFVISIGNINNLESPSSGNLEELHSPMTQTYSWVSYGRREVLMHPHASVRIPLFAMFCTPGTYNLSTLSISVNVEDTLSLYPLPPYLIIVAPCESAL